MIYYYCKNTGLNNNQLATFNCYFPGYCVHGISALDSKKMLIGRPMAVY